MDIFSILQLAIQYGPAVKSIIDEATTNDDIATKISTLSPTLGTVLGDLGAQLFPSAAPQLHVVGAAIAAFDPNTTKWLQKTLNTFLALSPPLTVDGIYGTKTKAAVQAAQSKLGLTVDGIAGTLTQAALQVILK